MDRISHLPNHVIDVVLNSLPLRDAVKTSVLGRAWRYKWLSLSKLVFNRQFWQNIPKGNEAEVYAAILLQHTGRLQEFHFSVHWELDLKTEVVNASIQFALRKGVTRLSLQHIQVVLPSCVYSSAQLTHLELEEHGAFSPPALFHGLQNLVSFKLTSKCITNDVDNINNFISRCPNIKRIWLDINVDEELLIHAPKLEFLNVFGTISCICFQETKNLKHMDIEVQYSDFNYVCSKRCWTNFGCLVKLQHLDMNCGLFQHLVSADAPRRFPQRLGQLKVLKLGLVDLQNSDELQGLVCLFASSRNLSELSMVIGSYNSDFSEEVDFESYVDLYCGRKFKSLHTVFVDVRTSGSKLDIKMIGFLLGCSPCLEMMSIRCSCQDLVNFLKEVMRLTRASPKASIVFL